VTVAFEDLTPGLTVELGSVEVTEAEIIDFATRYDPQPFHVDPVAAAASPYGGLIASGWHTCALYMRLLFDGMIHDSTSQGSPGMEDLRWLAPVRPGDRLSASYTVEDATPSATRPMRGTVLFRCEMTNQDGVVVLRMRGRGLYGRRSVEPEGQSDERL
jgi:acyl dehydratase